MPQAKSSLLLAVLAGLFTIWIAPGVSRASDGPVALPQMIDLKRKIDPPDLTTQGRHIRFFTEDDYPPFHFIGPDGQLTGFEVDLARAICAELKAACSIQPRRWDILKDSLVSGQGDAIIAAMRISPESRRDVLFSAAYFRHPARFVAATSRASGAVSAADLAERTVAVVGKTAHEAYLKAFFPKTRLIAMPNANAALAAVAEATAELAFVDGVAGALWLNSTGANGCCRFVGGPYLDSRYFGEGAGIAVARNNRRLSLAFDWALQRIAANGSYAALYLKYFPIGIY